MNIKKPLLVAGVTSSLALASIAGLGVVSAADSTTANDGQSSLINKITTRFNLNKDQVKAVFDEDHATREAAHQKAVETALTQAVSDGKLTNDQKDKILAKRAEIKADMEKNRDSMNDRTKAEHKAAMEQKHTELKQWATDNNIPTDYQKFVFGGGHSGPGEPGHGGPRLDDDRSATQ